MWYDVRMTKADIIDIAKARFIAYVQKLYGDKIYPSEESLALIERYLSESRSNASRLKIFLAVCDVSELYALRRNTEATDIRPTPEEQLKELFHACRDNFYRTALTVF